MPRWYNCFHHPFPLSHQFSFFSYSCLHQPQFFFNSSRCSLSFFLHPFFYLIRSYFSLCVLFPFSQICIHVHYPNTGLATLLIPAAYWWFARPHSSPSHCLSSSSQIISGNFVSALILGGQKQNRLKGVFSVFVVCSFIVIFMQQCNVLCLWELRHALCGLHR